MGDRAKIEAKQNRTDCLKMSFKAFGYIFAVRQNTNRDLAIKTCPWFRLASIALCWLRSSSVGSMTNSARLSP
jgi:hypothetical protein